MADKGNNVNNNGAKNEEKENDVINVRIIKGRLSERSARASGLARP